MCGIYKNKKGQVYLLIFGALCFQNKVVYFMFIPME